MMVEDVKIKDVFCRIYRPNTKPTEVVIMVHGFAGDKESSVICALGEELSNSGIQVVSFDLPCHGADVKNEYVNATDCMLALTKVVNYVEEEFDTLKISFFATSFGGYLLLNFLSINQEKYNKIILRAPAVNMGEILEKVIIPEHGFSVKDLNKGINLGYENPLLVNKAFLDELKNNDLFKKFKENLNEYHVLQGLKDDVVDVKSVLKFLKENIGGERCNFYPFENADHRFKNPGELEQIIKITKDILIG